MVDCARCGYKNDSGSKFCAACGTAMAAPSGSPAAGPSWNMPAPPPPAQELPPTGIGGPWPPNPYGPGPSGPQQDQVPSPQYSGYGGPPAQVPTPGPPPYPAYGSPSAPPYAPPPAPAYTPEALRARESQPQGGAAAGLNPYAETVGSAGGWPPAGWPAATPGAQEPWSPGQDAAFASTARPPGEQPERPVVPEPMRYPPPAPSPAQAPSFVPPAEVGEPPVRMMSSQAPSPARGGLDPEQVAPDTPRVLAGFLVSFEGDGLGQFWPFHQGRNEVGRLGANPNLDLAIDHPTTSSRHAVLLASARPSRLKIEDVGSTNGTYVNGERLATGMKQELRDGDAVRFGGFTTTVKLL